MALPTFQTVGAGVGGIADISVVWPVHAIDDLGVLVVEHQDGTAAAPAGWTQFPDSPQVGDGGIAGICKLAVFWKVAASAAEANVVVADTGNHTYGVILVFRGTHLTTPQDVTAGDAITAAATAVSVPGDTTTVADCLVVLLCARGTDNDTAQFSGWTNADLATLTERFDAGTIEGGGGGLGIATGEKATAGAYAATTATLATTAVQARISIALKPPAGGTVTFDAAIAGTGTVTDALALTKTLAATVAGQGTVVAGLALTKTLEAAVAGQGAVTIDLEKQRPFEVAVAGTSTVTADLAAQRSLAALIAGQGTVAAALTLTEALEATIAGQGALTADLALQKTLAALIAGQAVVTADLAEQKTLDATVTGTSTVTGALALTNMLAAAVAGQGTLTIDLEKQRALDAVVAGTATVIVGLAAQTALAAAIAGQATVVATLDLPDGTVAAVTVSYDPVPVLTVCILG